MKTFLKLLSAVLLGWGYAGPAWGADTAGTVSFNVTVLNEGGTYNPRHVVAVWVTNQALGYIKCLWKDGSGWTGEGTSHLTQLQAARGTSTTLDGHSGSTITSYNPFTVTWDCMNAAKTALVPDGTYYFFVETTDRNSPAGPYSGPLAWYKGPNAFTTNYPNQAYIQSMSLTYTPLPHDIAVTQILPPTAQTNALVNVQVTVTNKSAATESSVSVTLSNLTSPALLGAQVIPSLGGRASTNLTFPWSTTNLALGPYQFLAAAGPVASETNLTDNTLLGTVTLQAIPHDIAVLSISPAVGFTNGTSPVRVLVTNETPTTESFSVVLSNLTGSTLIATQQVANLAGNAATNVSFIWNTLNLSTGSYTLQATAGPVPNEVGDAMLDNTRTSLMTLGTGTHDVAVLAVVTPALVLSNSATNITVVVTNVGDLADSFNVKLYDDTAGRMIGSNQVNNLASLAGAGSIFNWRTTNVVLAYHSLRAVASGVAGETGLLNNTNACVVPVALGRVTNLVVARSNYWRYHDKGVDLTDTPWKLPSYYDLVWSEAKAPLGYSAAPTNVTTTISWGTNANNKYPTYYFRRAFNLDALPLSASVTFRRDDGLVVYFNGAEVLRSNLPPTGPISYTNWATVTVGTDNTNYFVSAVSPGSLVTGPNEVAVEVHQAANNSSDVAFDLELSAVLPVFPSVHDVDVLAVSTPGDVLAGDKMPVDVVITNSGNATETLLVFLKDVATGQILGSNLVTSLHPADSTSVRFDWATLGATNGIRALQAYTVAAGVTNLAGAATANVTISGSGFSLNALNAAGAIGGRCSAVVASGTLLLVGAGANLEVWDRSNAASPVKVGAVRLPGMIRSLTASGSYAYAACGNAGVQFVDLSIPSLPRPVNTFNTSGNANDVVVNGNYLYVADGVAGVRIVNVANPAAPALAAAYYTEGPARAIAVAGPRAYVLDQQKGLLILNVAVPAAPGLMGTYTGFDAGQALAVSAANAYIVDGNNHFLVVNIANPLAPTLAGSLLLTNLVGQTLVLNGTTVYVAAGENGLLAINAAAPTVPTLASSLPVPGQAVGLSLAGSSLYLADGFAGLQVLNVSSPLAPALQTDLPVALRASDAVVISNLAYVACGEAGVRIFSLTNASAPALVGRFTAATNARCLAVSGTTAYIGDGQYGLKIVNVANPSAPVLLGSYSSANLGSLRNVGVSGSLVVLSDGLHVHLVNTAVPGNPSLVSAYDPPAFAFALAVAGGNAYLACGNFGLDILSLTPSALTPIALYDTMGLATDVSVSGDRAFVANGTNGWLILDVSNPAVPALLKTVTAQGGSYGVAAAGNLVTVGNGANSAITLDVTAPLTPVTTNVFKPLVRALRLSATPTLALAAEDEAGLALLSTTTDLDQDGLADAWEQQIVNASLATNGPIHTIWDVLPGDDFDKDGMSNYAEHVAGTSPIDTNSRLVLFIPAASSGTSATVQWTSVPGKTYTVWKSTNLGLANGFAILKDNIVATQNLSSYTDEAPGGNAFYMVTVR